jgi:DNA-binding transcriptional MerR regulator
MKPLGFSLEEMRELLEVVDRLGAADLPVDDRAALRDRLRGFQRAAQEQRDKLVEQLSRAQEFIATLQQLDDEAS